MLVTSKRGLVNVCGINKGKIVHMPLFSRFSVCWAVASSGGWGKESQHFLFRCNSSGCFRPVCAKFVQWSTSRRQSSGGTANTWSEDGSTAAPHTVVVKIWYRKNLISIINTFAGSYLNTQGLNNSYLKSPASTLVDLTFQSRALRSFSLNQLRNLSL